MNIQYSLLKVINIADILEARSKLKIGDKVVHKKFRGVNWSHPSLNHKITKGGVITYMSSYRPEIDVKWLESGNVDTINPLDVIKRLT